MRNLFLLFTACIVTIFIFSSCTKMTQDGLHDDAEEIQNIALNRVSFSTNGLALGESGDWQLFAGSKVYKSVLTDDSLIGTPLVDDYFYFEHRGDLQRPRNTPVYFYYSSKAYCEIFGPVNSDIPTFMPPNIFNQDSYDKLRSADLLMGSYDGSAVSQVDDIHLFRANALLDFEVIGLKRTDTVILNDLKQSFLPYQDEHGYKAIVTGDWVGIERGSALGVPPIQIEIESPSATVTPLLLEDFYPIKGNTKYQFTLTVDYSKGEIAISDTSEIVWNNEVL